MKFNSQICTTREQSQRLLSLGLKKETADMVYRSYGYIIDEFGNKGRRFKQPTMVVEDWESKYDIPAWSLHRLLELNLLSCEQHFAFQFHITNIDNAYDYLVNHIEWLIKEKHFPKEYLV